MELPQCRHCEDYARPNVAFFDDDLGSNARTFNPKYIEPQRDPWMCLACQDALNLMVG